MLMPAFGVQAFSWRDQERRECMPLLKKKQEDQIITRQIACTTKEEVQAGGQGRTRKGSSLER
jgi:hypothetical protein